MNTTAWNSDRALNRHEFETFMTTFSHVMEDPSHGSPSQCIYPRQFDSCDSFDCLRVIVVYANVDICGMICNRFNLTQYSQEGNLIVFKVGGFKVEMHIINSDECEFAREYMSYNASGSILGKLLHQMGMKLSCRGLFYLIREQMFDGDSTNGHILEEVVLTNHWGDMLRLLGLKMEDWEYVLSKEDLFNLIITSSEFCPQVFADALVSQNDTFPLQRSANDVFYQFCQWITSLGLPTRGFRRRRVYRKGLYTLFPMLKNRMFAHSGKVLRKKEIHRKLNPASARVWLALEEDDPSVHRALKTFRSKHDELEILSMSQEEIRSGIVHYYNLEQQLQEP